MSLFRRLFVLLKYWGFSITGILVMPMITASGPISEEEGVLLPLETWWRGEAESSSLLITEDGPERARGGKSLIADPMKLRTNFTLVKQIFLITYHLTSHLWNTQSALVLNREWCKFNPTQILPFELDYNASITHANRGEVGWHESHADENWVVFRGLCIRKLTELQVSWVRHTSTTLLLVYL